MHIPAQKPLRPSRIDRLDLRVSKNSRIEIFVCHAMVTGIIVPAQLIGESVFKLLIFQIGYASLFLALVHHNLPIPSLHTQLRAHLNQPCENFYPGLPISITKYSGHIS